MKEKKSCKPIRVLVINYKMHCAGIESFIMNVYRNIDREKVQFDFLVHYTERQFYDDEIERMGGKIYRLSIREDNNFLKYVKELKKFFYEHPEYKIVHGHMESFGIFYLKAAREAKIPIRIAHSHIAQKNRGIKGSIKTILNKGYKWYATDLFACSEVAGKFIFGDKAKYKIFNNAIDAKTFKYNEKIRDEVREELGISDEQFVIGHVGRFNTQKNHNFLVDIFNEIYKADKNAILLLIGEGDLYEYIEEKVAKLELMNNVRLLGVRKDTNRLYQAMDIFLMPSLFEGLPISGIEAQAAGLKCIFSNTITVEVALTKNTEFISLDAEAKEWAKEVLKWKFAYSREEQTKEIEAAGYDIHEQAIELQKFYLEALRGE